ncbi:MAG: hypothetical protein FJ319_00950 [SAR202 cluster bacterium]|nr:hypothetical protein [SAR202 cluster bacterium]
MPEVTEVSVGTGADRNQHKRSQDSLVEPANAAEDVNSATGAASPPHAKPPPVPGEVPVRINLRARFPSADRRTGIDQELG